MQPGEAIFLLNYEDICFVMKDWPRPGTSSRPGPSRSRSRSPVPVPVSRVRHSTFSHCVILAQRATAGVAPVLFFFVFPLRFVLFCIPLLLCSLLRICCTVVSCHEDDGGGGVVRFQFGAAGRSKQRIVNFAFVWSLPNALRLPLLPRLPAALQVKCTRNGRWEEGGVIELGAGRDWSICATVTVTHES